MYSLERNTPRCRIYWLDGQKFKTKNFKQLLLDIHQKPMAEQREILNTTIDNWRGRWEQVDDIIVLGVRI